VFVKERGKWRLAGLLFLVGGFPNQPAETALYGNFTLSADLARYRSQIEELISKPMKRGAAEVKEGSPTRSSGSSEK